MAITELTLLFVGFLAFVSSAAGVFIRFDDRWTNPLVAFLGAMLWGIMAISSLDVNMPGGGSDSIIPLVAVGFGLAFLTALFALNDIVTGTAEEASEADIDLLS